jgi:hypothetical protein
MSRENANPEPYALPAEPSLEDLLRILGRMVRLSIRTHVPAQVVAYDPSLQKATVLVQTLPVVRVSDPTKLPATMVAIKGVPPNATATLAPITLVNIPVAFPYGGQGGMTWPVMPGDYGELHVSDRSLAAWLQSGAPCDPVIAATHALADSVFHPGLHPDTQPIVPPTDLTATVIEGAAQIKLGRNAAQSVTLAEPLTAALDAFANAVPVPQDGGAAIHTAFKVAWEIAKPLLASMKVKSE